MITSQAQYRSNVTGALCALLAVMCFSINDVGFKSLSSDYALHQVVFIRSLVGTALFAVCLMPFNGWFRVFRTRRLGMHLLRGICVVSANTCLFLGLSALPIADAIAVFFISPFVITIFSVVILNETVGARRWTAILIGFIGVMIIIKPGTSAFQIASLLPMAAAVLYGLMHILARKIGGSESAITMVLYIQLTFLFASAIIGLTVGDGQFAGSNHPSLAFLLRPWGAVDPGDWPLLILLGCTGLLGGLFISQAYRLSEVAFIAPFEYISMPMAIIWGIIVFGTFPNVSAWIGIALILGSGLYQIWREAYVNRRAHA